MNAKWDTVSGGYSSHSLLRWLVLGSDRLGVISIRMNQAAGVLDSAGAFLSHTPLEVPLAVYRRVGKSNKGRKLQERAELYTRGRRKFLMRAELVLPPPPSLLGRPPLEAPHNCMTIKGHESESGGGGGGLQGDH